MNALILVDIQNDFLPGGALAVPHGDEVIAVANRVATTFDLVVATQDWHPPVTPHFAKDGGIWPVHCVADTWGAELHPSLALPGDAPRVRKGVNGEDGYSGFTTRDPVTGETARTELDGLLKTAGVTRVTVVGLATDYCINATALDAIELGYRVNVLVDACAAVDLKPGDGERALAGLDAAGVDMDVAVPS